MWGWQECQRPRFLYTKDLAGMYPGGVFPTAFFLHRSYLVLMPDPVFPRGPPGAGQQQQQQQHNANANNQETQKAMIRVHDLSRDLELVGSYDFPRESRYRRHVEPRFATPHEACHLHKVRGTNAVGEKLRRILQSLRKGRKKKRVCFTELTLYLG